MAKTLIFTQDQLVKQELKLFDRFALEYIAKHAGPGQSTVMLAGDAYKLAADMIEARRREMRNSFKQIYPNE